MYMQRHCRPNHFGVSPPLWVAGNHLQREPGVAYLGIRVAYHAEGGPKMLWKWPPDLGATHTHWDNQSFLPTRRSGAFAICETGVVALRVAVVRVRCCARVRSVVRVHDVTESTNERT